MTVAVDRFAAVARLDEAAEAWLDRVRGHPVLDRLMYAASKVGDWSVIWHVVAWSRAAVDPKRVPEAVRLSVCLGAESLIVNQGIKRLFRRARPAYEGDHPHPLRTPSTTSFPSGHASAAAVAALLLADGDPDLTPLWFLAAVVVAGSRPYVRMHHASDTLGGAVIGIALGRLALRLWPR